MPCEVEAIVDAFETYADKDFSHRRLAHRGSYDGFFWVSASTVRRVLNDHDLRFRHPPRPSGSKRRPFPVWATYRPNSTWIHDSTHFTACGMTVLIIEDLVSRKWITHVETHLQVRLAFEQALEAERTCSPPRWSALRLSSAGWSRTVTMTYSAATGRIGQRVADDRCQYPQVYDHGRHRPALRPPGNPH